MVYPFSVVCHCVFCFGFLRTIHLLELRYSSLKTMLHAIAKLPISLSHFLVGHGQDSFHVLERKSVTFHTFKGLSTTNQGLDIVGFNLQYSGAIRNGSIEVGNLLVASCARERERERKREKSIMTKLEK